jgi:competence protein ComEC
MKKYILLLIICLVCVSGCVNPFSANTTQNATKAVTPTAIPATQPPVVIPVITTLVTPEVTANVTVNVTLNVTANVTANVTVNPPRTNGSNLTVTFINVGQGDSEWIVSPTGKTMLLDAGESTQVSKVESVIVTQNKTINVVVATHPHSDHIGGMQTILSQYTVDKFIDAGYPYTSSVYENMLVTIDKKNISYTTVKTGDNIVFDPFVDVKVLNPQPKFFNEVNDNSVVLLMTYQNVSFLFTGDSQLNAETMYAKSLKNVTVLKVAHHGSISSTGAYLISKTHPKVSIISVGKNNPYDHPDSSTIKRLVTDGSKVYRTDLNGTISITTNGEQYSVITGK